MMRVDGWVFRLLSPRIGSNMAEDFIILVSTIRLSELSWTPRLTTGHRPQPRESNYILKHIHNFQALDVLPA